jgi:hypothetical protein
MLVRRLSRSESRESLVYVNVNQKMGRKRRIKMANRSFEDVAKFRYLETTLTRQNCMHEEIKSRLNSGNSVD